MENLKVDVKKALKEAVGARKGHVLFLAGVLVK